MAACCRRDRFHRAVSQAFWRAGSGTRAFIWRLQASSPRCSCRFAQAKYGVFTGGFHGGWGNGSGWAALDFAPPFEPAKPYACFTSAYPLVAVADGVIARLAEGALILDLDMDGDEGSGWSILYLHITRVESLRTGQAVAAGETLGYALLPRRLFDRDAPAHRAALQWRMAAGRLSRLRRRPIAAAICHERLARHRLAQSAVSGLYAAPARQPQRHRRTGKRHHNQ